VHRGIGVSVDAFYRGLLDLGFETYAAAGAICVEMECSALFIVGTLRRVRTGAIVAIDGDARRAASGDHDPHKNLVRAAIDREIAVALDAVAHLASASAPRS
jgi:uridine phosphorylase